MKIDLELLEKTLRADGWTMNATDYILLALVLHEEVVEMLKRLSLKMKKDLYDKQI